MKRIKLPSLLVIVHLLLPFLGAQDKPNVLMIAIDDMNDWVGAMGNHPDIQTPNIDRLAASGVLFNNAHCQFPVCGPSRTSVFSGYGLRRNISSCDTINFSEFVVLCYFKNI